MKILGKPVTRLTPLIEKKFRRIRARSFDEELNEISLISSRFSLKKMKKALNPQLPQHEIEGGHSQTQTRPVAKVNNIEPRCD